MRTPQAVRTSAFTAYALSLLAAVIVSFLLHLLLGSAGRGGFTDLNPGGILELVAFTLTFSNALLLTRQSFKLPITTLLSGGIYAPPNDQLALIRRFIERHPKKADALLRNKALLEEFGGLDKDAVLSRFPKGFPDGSQLLKYKSFTVSSAFDALELGSAAVLETVVSKCARMQVLHKYLREALTFEP